MKESGKNSRRRGDNLIESIYNATVKTIKEVGYANLTFQQIAQTAETSRTVLYRRWATTFDLIQEIKVYKSTTVLGGELFEIIKDTGSLRGDLIELLTLYQRIYTEVGSEIMNAYLFEISQNNKKIVEIQTNARVKNILIMRKLLGYAKLRGDNIKEVNDTTLILPFDLIRIENIFNKDVVDQSAIESLVDQILLPVFIE